MVTSSSSWKEKNTSEILYFRQNNQAMLSRHYLWLHLENRETKKESHLKYQKVCLVKKHLQGFAAIWHLTFWLHGDLEPENLGRQEYKPCVYLRTFLDFEMLFIQTTRNTSRACTKSTTSPPPFFSAWRPSTPSVSGRDLRMMMTLGYLILDVERRGQWMKIINYLYYCFPAMLSTNELYIFLRIWVTREHQWMLGHRCSSVHPVHRRSDHTGANFAKTEFMTTGKS